VQESATGSPAPIFGHYRTLLHPDGSPFILGNSRDGITYKAIDTRLGRPVGLKIISRELLWSPEAKQRFLRNARSAASIQHPNIATIFEIGTESDVYYIVTELPEGEDLERYVAREGPPWPEVALKVVSQVAQALDGFQARGLVHGNIKPSSIIATVDRLGELRVKLIDFDAVTANGIKRRFSLSARAIDSATS